MTSAVKTRGCTVLLSLSNFAFDEPVSGVSLHHQPMCLSVPIQLYIYIYIFFFISCQPKVALRTPATLSVARAGVLDRTSLDNYFDELEHHGLLDQPLSHIDCLNVYG